MTTPDLNFFKVDFDLPGAPAGVKVHGGFYKAYDNVKATILPRLQALLKENPGFVPFIGGHSLGASLAQLMAADLTANFNLRYVTTVSPLCNHHCRGCAKGAFRH